MIESEFGVLILEEEFRKLSTISDIIEYVSKHKK
jgi:acyl carrier protein